MTSFVHIDYALEHPGVQRAEAAFAAIGEMRQNFNSARTLSAMLLAAVVAALVVVADHMMDTWADGHLLTAWVALWAVAFAAMGLLAPVAKQTARNMIRGYKAYALRSANAREEDAFWQSALNDPRVMAEYQAAKLRFEEAEILAQTSVEPQATLELVNAKVPVNIGHLRYV